VAWCSAPRHLGSRDRFIGWEPKARLRNVRLLAYNTRFLILPWVQVPHLASHLLGRMARMLSADWQRVYAHPIYFLDASLDTQESQRGLAHHGELRCRERSLENGLTDRNMADRSWHPSSTGPKLMSVGKRRQFCEENSYKVGVHCHFAQ